MGYFLMLYGMNLNDQKYNIIHIFFINHIKMKNISFKKQMKHHFFIILPCWSFKYTFPIIKTDNAGHVISYTTDDVYIPYNFRNITLNYLYLVLNERLISGKAVVINTNLMPDEILERYGERIFSRVMNKQTGLVLCYKGKDRRVNC